MTTNITTLFLAFFFSASLLLPTHSYSQAGSIDSNFGIDGYVFTDFAIGTGNDYAHSTAIQKDGKIVVAGIIFISSSDKDVGLVRYNNDGSLDSIFGINGKVVTAASDSDDTAFSMVIQDDGKIVVTGTTTDSTNNRNALIIRYHPDGSLDDSFGSNGIAAIDLAGSSDYGKAIALQDDGKILIVGHTISNGTGTGVDFFTLRLHTNGTLDSSFGTDGIVITSMGMFADRAEAIVIQDDEKIVVAGESNNGTDYDFAVVRYLSNGDLDTSFDYDGILTTSITQANGELGSGDDEGHSLALQSDGKILLAGSIPSGGFAITRYLTDGSLDSSFGGNGILISEIGSSVINGPSIVIQDDEKILIAGAQYSIADTEVTLFRFTSDGLLDASFGDEGIVFSPLGPFYERTADIALQNDGKIIVAGVGGTMESNDFFVARYNNDFNTGTTTIEKEEIEFTIYPNPSSEHFTIDWTGDKNVLLQIHNILGEEVLSQNINQKQQFSISHKGLYFVSLFDGTHFISRPILIQ